MENKERICSLAENVWAYIAAFLRWGVLGLLVGGLGGFVGALFSKSVAWATAMRGANPWLLYLLPVGGLAIVGVYKLCRVSGVGTNEVFEGVRSNKGVSILLAPAIFLGTTITHLLGGSAGREGAALQIGGSVATFFGKLFRLNEEDRHILTMCGMSAVFAAVFGTPMAACVFAIEVVSVGRFCTSALFPCIVSSASAYALALVMGVAPEHFLVENVPAFDISTMWRVLVIAILCAVASMLFCWAMHSGAKLFKRLFKNEFLRAAVGGIVVILLTLLVGTRAYNGGGMDVIERIFEEGVVRPEAFLLKMIFTSITIGAGFKGGEIVPIFFTGATFGCVVAPLLGLPPQLGAALGMIALFCGCTNSPLASICLAIEVFGGRCISLFALACAVSYMLSSYFSLYREQHFMHSKLRIVGVRRIHGIWAESDSDTAHSGAHTESK